MSSADDTYGIGFSDRRRNRRTLSVTVFAALLMVAGCNSTTIPAQVGVGKKQSSTHAFREAAAELGLDFYHFNGASGEFDMCEMVGPGGALFDSDGDGDLDLYVTTYRGGNHLFRNDGRGAFTDVTQQAGVSDPLWSSSSAWVDIDRDGWLDLFVCNYVQMNFVTHRMCKSQAGADDYCGPQVYEPEPSQLFRNRGDGTFEDVSLS
ncbi:MAG: VCBS repeat-containing protein, partial [Planctomycetaceae bacterium]